MKKKYLIMLFIIGSFLMLTLALGASYAYFSITRVSVNTNISNNSNITLSLNSTAAITFSVNPYTPISDELFAESGEVTTNVNLTNNGSSHLTCSYDIMYIPDSTTGVFVPSPANSDNLQELVIIGTDSTGQNSSFSFDLVNKPYAADTSYKIMTATISANNGQTVAQKWKFKVAYYNYNFEQSINAGKNIKGRIIFKANDCTNNRTALTIVNGLVGSSNTDSNSLPWTVKSEDGLRYEGKNPNNYICFQNSCSSSYLYRIVGVLDDEALDGDSTLYTSKLLKLVKSTSGISIRFGNTGDWKTSNIRSYLSDYSNNTSLRRDTSKILNAKWYLRTSTVVSLTPNQMYEAERTGENVIGDFSFDKIGLIYISDFLYSSYESGSCNHSDAYSSTYAANCKDSTYLLPTGISWTITPAYAANSVRYYTSDGTVSGIASSGTYLHNPAFYMKSNVLLSGTGTESDPYRIVR
ncbi:MAG: hypothetical protein IKR74_04325 [Bacilli bacterium]|nr:hypothetical protein [Bacilli bacterium]